MFLVTTYITFVTNSCKTINTHLKVPTLLKFMVHIHPIPQTLLESISFLSQHHPVHRGKALASQAPKSFAFELLQSSTLLVAGPQLLILSLLPPGPFILLAHWSSLNLSSMPVSTHRAHYEGMSCGDGAVPS